VVTDRREERGRRSIGWRTEGRERETLPTTSFGDQSGGPAVRVTDAVWD
jgi:hypothetical protein